MKATIFALSFALVAGACADQRAARRDPAYVPTTKTTAASENYPSETTYSNKSSGTTTTTSTNSTRTTSTDPLMRTEPQSSAPTTSTWGSDTSRSGSSSTDRGGAFVTANPGVADRTPGADNTTINVRDRHDALTPGDQGNSATETKITAEIRKGLMASKTLSFTAKNAKVITTGTKVTLRGTVKSVDERAEIESVAKSTHGVSEVDNQLEVKK